MEQKKQVIAVMPIKAYEDLIRFLRKLPFETVEEIINYLKSNTRAVEVPEEQPQQEEKKEENKEAS